MITFTDLRTFTTPIPRWVLPNWIGRDSLTLLIGAGGASKSWLSLDLAVAASSGQPFFGYTLDPIRIAYIDEDGQHIETMRRLSRLCSGRKLQVADLADRLFISPSVGLHLDQPDHYANLALALNKIKADLIIFDALCAIHGKDENDNGEMSIVMRGLLRQLMRDTGAGILLLHHEGKPGEFAKSGPFKARGATEIPNASDIALNCAYKDHEQVLSQIRNRLIARPDWPEDCRYSLVDEGNSTHLVLNLPEVPQKTACIALLSQLSPLPSTVDAAYKALNGQFSRATVGRSLLHLRGLVSAST